VIGRLEKTVIDCPDPRALAEFYCQLLGMTVSEDIDSGAVIGAEPGLRQLAFQRVDKWIPPRCQPPARPGRSNAHVPGTEQGSRCALL
jgi:hypothetical protein